METSHTLPITPIAFALSLGLLGAAHSLHAAVVPCEVTIDFGASVPLRWDAAAHAAFRREATRVWAFEGVRFCWPGETACQAGATLYVRVVNEVPAARQDGPPALGWMGFSERTGPGPLILLSQRWASDLVGRAERGARALADLPGMIARLLPRALGRALAHELGHYLLVRREHVPVGLMRAAFRPEDLADDGTGQRLALTPADRQAVRARCGARATTLTASSRSTTPSSSR